MSECCLFITAVCIYVCYKAGEYIFQPSDNTTCSHPGNAQIPMFFFYFILLEIVLQA